MPEHRTHSIGAEVLAVLLAAVPLGALIAMNTMAWRVSFETIVLAYRAAVFGGLAMALASIYASIRQFRATGFSITLAVAVVLAMVFVIWVAAVFTANELRAA